MHTKILSIITINRNNAAGLERTIQSVICQKNTDFEYIIIDGGSSDESVEVIQKYAEKINYWVSEPDTGVYNAMNKGIRKAQGEFCLFLNSGDWLISPETLDAVFKEINGNPSDIFYSDMIKSTNVVEYYPRLLTMNYLIRRTINHQNSLIRRSLFLEHGFYNENLTIASDWEFFLREFWKYKSKFQYMETIISFFDVNGIGSRPSTERIAEHTIVLQNVFQELADTIIDYRDFRSTVYYDIYKNYGNPKLLVIISKVYRKLIIFICRIISLLGIKARINAKT